jgi:tetratricopeptide (TPR) repeat protein
MNPNRILVGCAVKENNVEYTNLETEYLFKTLDTFGGNLKNVKKIACFTEKPDSFFENILTKMGVKIRINNKLDERQSFANKINILKNGIKEDVDVIVMLDTDIVVARDFSEFLDTQKIMIKPEDRDPFSLTDWKQLFDYFKINFPSERFHTSCSHQETIPYFNGGVIIIPKVFAKEFLDQWKYFLKKLLDEKLNLPMNFITNARFFDQIAFSLALIQSKLPYGILPLSMNYPYSGTVHSSENPQSLEPFIIHHHHCILETGNLMHCPYENINVKIDKINEFLTDNTEIKIDIFDKASVISIRNLTMMQEFEKVTERLSTLPLDDSNPSLQYYLALSLHNTKKNFDEALIRYTKALELGFEDYMVYADRGWLYYMMGDIKNATNDLIKSFTINPYDLETKKRLARLDPRIDQVKLLCDEKSFKDVIKILSDLKLDDPNPFLQYYLALSLHNTLQKFDEALIRYTMALEFGFEPFWIFLNRGSLQLLQNNLNDSGIDLIEAQKIDPNNFEVNRQLNLLKYAVPETQYYLKTIKNKDGYIAHIEIIVKEKDAYLEQALKEKDAYLEQALKEKDAYLEQALKEKDAYLEQAIKQYQDTINQIRASKSWRITHLFTKKI